MGIFGSKTVITVGTSMSPLVQEKPNIVRSAILRATFNDWEKTPTIVDAIINGYSIDPRGYYRYGENHYYYGLPEGHRPQVIVRDAELIDILAYEHGVTANEIDIEILSYSSYFQSTAGHWYLYQQGELDIKTGNIAKLPFLPEGVIAEVGNIDVKEIYDNGDGLTQPDLLYVELTAQLTYAHPDSPEQTTEYEHKVVLTESDINVKDFFNKVYNAKYRVLDTSTSEYSATLYFIYDPELDLYPELDVYEEEDLNSPYYPVVPLRDNKEWTDENHPAFKSINKILKYVGVDMPAIQEALKENPDIDDVDSSFIVLGMPIGGFHERDHIDSKYLYRYFEYLRDRSKVDKAKFTSSLNQDNVAYNVIQIRDAGFSTSLYWNYIEEGETYYNSVLAGKYVLEVSIDYNEKDPKKAEDFYSTSFIQIVYHDKRTKKAKYIRAHGLFHVSEVYHSKHVVNTIKNAFHWDEDERTDGFFLPLCEEVMNTLSKREYTHVAYSSLILLNYAVIKTKIKWYQRKAFWRLVQIILVIVSIYTMQPQLAALATQAVSEIAFLIIQSVVVNYLIGEAIGYVLSLLADVIGGQAAVIITAIVTAVAMIYVVGAQFNLKLPFADEVLKISNLMMTEIQKLQNARAQQLKDDISTFNDEYRALRDEIEAAQDLLGIEGSFNPYWVLEGGSVIAGESASDFLTRNVNLNPNEACFDAVTNFTENALRLPSLASVNNNFRGF